MCVKGREEMVGQRVGRGMQATGINGTTGGKREMCAILMGCKANVSFFWLLSCADLVGPKANMFVLFRLVDTVRDCNCG